MPYAWEVDKNQPQPADAAGAVPPPNPTQGQLGVAPGTPGVDGGEVAVTTGPDGNVASVAGPFKIGDVVRQKAGNDGKSKSGNAFKIDSIDGGVASGKVVTKGATKGAKQSARLEELEAAPSDAE